MQPRRWPPSPSIRTKCWSASSRSSSSQVAVAQIAIQNGRHIQEYKRKLSGSFVWHKCINVDSQHCSSRSYSSGQPTSSTAACCACAPRLSRSSTKAKCRCSWRCISLREVHRCHPNPTPPVLQNRTTFCHSTEVAGL